MKKLLFFTLFFLTIPSSAMEGEDLTLSQIECLNESEKKLNSTFENNQECNKKRKSDDVGQINAQAHVLFLRKIYFDSAQIKEAISNILMQEEGKILAACYMVTSDALTDAWIARKYVQHYQKAKKDNNLKHMIIAAKQLTSKKNDILIIDKENLKKDTSALQKLHEHGISILIRNKDRQPGNKMQAMHLKFMVIFDEKNETPKLLIKGSYNFTNQAFYNFEDVEITNDADVMQQYHEQHIKLRDYCEEFKNPST